MRLTLFYRGALHAQTRRNNRVEEKHRLRQCFHKQIADLWETHPAVEDILNQWRRLPAEEQIRNGPNDFVTAYDVGRFRFVPLVTKRSWLSCELDILFLRHEPPGNIVDEESGDLDNRIKVLFDSLRMPKPESSELPSGVQPMENERPFLCLLENDGLVTRFSIKTDRLLSRQMATESEVELVIEVKIKAIKLTYQNLGVSG